MACILHGLSACAKEGAEAAVDSLSKAIADACAWMVKESFTWWVETDPEGVNGQVAAEISRVTQPLSLGIAVAGVIVVGIKMAMNGKPDPLVPMGISIFKMAFWSTCGTLVVNQFMTMSNSFSGWVLGNSADDKFAKKFAEVFGFGSYISLAAAVIVLGLLGFLAGVAQWVIGLMREGSVTVLAGLLPLAASGELLGGAAQGWMPRVFGWLLALIFWQAAASLVYFTAFHLIGDARNPEDTLVGLAMMLVALLALPSLMKLFSWAAGSVTESRGGGGLMGTATLAAAALRSQAAHSEGAQVVTARQQAESISRALGDPGGAPGASPEGARPGPSGDSGGGRGGNSTTVGGPGGTGAGGAGQGSEASAASGPTSAAGTGGSAAAAQGARAASGAAAGAGAAGAGAAAGAVAGPAGAAVVAAQAAHGAAQSAANKMTNPPNSGQ
jgi:hypothetical protein